jgi:hypothetical protein
MGVLASCGLDRRAIIWDLSKEPNDEISYGLVKNIYFINENVKSLFMRVIRAK